MILSRGRGRGTKPSWQWLLRAHTIQRLLVALFVLGFLGTQIYFYNTTTRKYKDCSVPWPTATGFDEGSVDSALISAHWARIAQSGTRGVADGGTLNDAGKMRIALVSMSTGRAADSAERAAKQAAMNARSAEFAGLLDITGPNKQQYAEQHGYSYVDASDLLDNSRPASWSKIPAVLSLLDRFDWIFWLDADTLITNLTLPVEALLPPPELAGAGVGAGAAPDLVLTADSTGVNAGVWLMRGRGCLWCRHFLELWWSQESFIRGAHDTKSGDNDALKHLIATMDRSELVAHVGLAPQCAFNSYLWRPSLRNYLRYLVNTKHVLTGLWKPGDFVMHAAGVHNKMAVLRRFIKANGLISPTAGSELAGMKATGAGGGASWPPADGGLQGEAQGAVSGPDALGSVGGERALGSAGLGREELRTDGRELLLSDPPPPPHGESARAGVTSVPPARRGRKRKGVPAAMGRDAAGRVVARSEDDSGGGVTGRTGSPGERRGSSGRHGQSEGSSAGLRARAGNGGRDGGVGRPKRQRLGGRRAGRDVGAAAR